MANSDDSINLDSDDEENPGESLRPRRTTCVTRKELIDARKHHKQRLKSLFKILEKLRVKMKYLNDLVEMISERKR